MDNSYDIAIIGLGPACSTLARLLSDQFRVIAVDKKQPEGKGGFHKPCGGLLATDAQKALSRFHLTLPLGVLADPQIFSVRTIDVRTGQVRHYQRFYMNMDRHRLDQWLRSLVPQSVRVLDNARCSGIRKMPDGYRVTCRGAGGEEEFMARMLVGADGASSLVRRTVYPDAKLRRYLAIQEWYSDTHATPFYSCVFDPDSTDCYAWGLSKQGYFLFGGAFAPKGGREKFEGLKQKLLPYGFRFGEPVKTEACMVLRPTGPGSFRCGRDNAFLVGEAAGFISPSSLEGLSYAFDSALALSTVLNGGAGDLNAAYHRETRRIRLKLLGKQLKSPFMYQPFLRRLVMTSGIASIEVEE